MNEQQQDEKVVQEQEGEILQEQEATDTIDDVQQNVTSTVKEKECRPDAVTVSNGYKFILLVVALLAAAASAASYMLWVELKKTNDNLSSQIDSELKYQLQAVSDSQQKKFEELETITTQNRSGNKQLLQMLQTLQEELEEQSRSDIKLIQAESILRLAKSQYEILHDRTTTVAALEVASSLLNGYPHPQITVIQGLIESELQSVKELIVPDIGAELIKLDLMINNSDGLPLITAAPDKQSKLDTPSNNDQTNKNWNEKFKSLLKALQPLVTVRRNKGPTVAMLSVEEEKLVRVILKSRYEQIRQSMLHKNTDLLNVSTGSVRKWLVKYFDVEKPPVINALQNLTSWDDLVMDVEYPPVGYALQQMTKFRAQGMTKTRP